MKIDPLLVITDLFVYPRLIYLDNPHKVKKDGPLQEIDLH